MVLATGRNGGEWHEREVDTSGGLGGLAFALASGLVASTVQAAEPAPVYTGTITDAYLWSYIDYSGRGRDDGIAVVAKSHQEEGNLDTEVGWYMVEGLSSAEVMWGASTTAPPGTTGSCLPSVAVDGAPLYTGAPAAAFASWSTSLDQP